MFEYRVQFDVFEGPLDLLLYLIKKEEVDIYEINLTKIATEFIEYIEMMRELDLAVAGDFLVMASTLMHIKSRELLPVEEKAANEEEESEENPKWELIRRLVEYKKFKEAAGKLQQLEVRQEHVFPRKPNKVEMEPPAARASNQASVFALIGAVNKVLKRLNERRESRDIFEDPWTVSQKVQELTQLAQERRQIRFLELFTHATTRSEVVATFLALLELIRMKTVVAFQWEPFGEIEIRLFDPSLDDDPEGPVPSTPETADEPARAGSADAAAATEKPPVPMNPGAEAEPWN